MASSSPAYELLAVKGLRERTDNAFRWALIQVAARLEVDPNFLTAVMANESGFDPSVVNSIGATGLIQFMPSTAKSLGTTTAELARMSAVEQLAWVEAYYRPFTGKMKSPEDAYMATFMPVHVGKSPDNVIAVQGDKVYDQNPGLDSNHDGVLTNGDVGRKARQRIEEALSLAPIVVTPVTPGYDPKKVLAGLSLLGVMYWLVRKA